MTFRTAIGSALARPTMHVWLRSSSRSWRYLPRPDGDTLVLAGTAPPGASPLSVLLLGGGPAVGFGVLSHELGLAGHLARQVSVASGRAVAVQTVTDIDMRADDATAALGWVALDRFEALVTTFGGNDALALTSGRAWRRSLRRFFDGVGEFAASGLATFVLGVAPISSLVSLPRGTRSLVDARVASINEGSRRVCDEVANATFVPFVPTLTNVVDEGNASTYAEWAQFLSPLLADRFTRVS